MQGMSDLAAPLLCIMRDEAEAFWCFACLMEKLEVRSLPMKPLSSCRPLWSACLGRACFVTCKMW